MSSLGQALDLVGVTEEKEKQNKGTMQQQQFFEKAQYLLLMTDTYVVTL